MHIRASLSFMKVRALFSVSRSSLLLCIMLYDGIYLPNLQVGAAVCTDTDDVLLPRICSSSSRSRLSSIDRMRNDAKILLRVVRIVVRHFNQDAWSQRSKDYTYYLVFVFVREPTPRVIFSCSLCCKGTTQIRRSLYIRIIRIY